MGNTFSTDPNVAMVLGHQPIDIASPGGVRVRTDSGLETHHDESTMPANGLIKIGGIEITVSEAKRYGLLPNIVKQATGEDVETNGLPVDGYEDNGKTDTLVDRADPALQNTQAALNTIEFQLGPQIDDTAKMSLVADIVDGEIDAETERALLERGLPVERVREMIDLAADEHAVRAERELGSEAFQWLSNYAAFDGDVRNLLVQHGIRQARGSKVSWKDVYNIAAERYAQTIGRRR